MISIKWIKVIIFCIILALGLNLEIFALKRTKSIKEGLNKIQTLEVPVDPEVQTKFTSYLTQRTSIFSPEIPVLAMQFKLQVTEIEDRVKDITEYLSNLNSRIKNCSKNSQKARDLEIFNLEKNLLEEEKIALCNKLEEIKKYFNICFTEKKVVQKIENNLNKIDQNFSKKTLAQEQQVVNAHLPLTQPAHQNQKLKQFIQTDDSEKNDDIFKDLKEIDETNLEVGKCAYQKLEVVSDFVCVSFKPKHKVEKLPIIFEEPEFDSLNLQNQLTQK